MHLVYVAGHAGDEGGAADGVHLGEAQGLDVGEECPAEAGRAADRGAGGKILRHHAAAKSHQRQHNEQAAPAENVTGIVVPDADVDDIRHHQGHKQVKERFKHFKKRRQQAHQPVPLEVGVEIAQGRISPFQWDGISSSH